MEFSVLYYNHILWCVKLLGQYKGPVIRKGGGTFGTNTFLHCSHMLHKIVHTLNTDSLLCSLLQQDNRGLTFQTKKILCQPFLLIWMQFFFNGLYSLTNYLAIPHSRGEQSSVTLLKFPQSIPLNISNPTYHLVPFIHYLR